jgi:antibiotic biosynthesis monooxygenase (ABM) superfamily enzyme
MASSNQLVTKEALVSNPTVQNAPRQAPPRYKLALLTWAGAYGVITLILGLLGPTMANWPLPLRTLLISVLMVVALTWVIVPTLLRVFRGWLFSARPRRFATPTGEGAASRS